MLQLERLGELYEITVRLPHLAATTAPGEFAQLRCGTGVVPLLRRPFSVAWTDGERCSFVFQVVGSGTRLLAQLTAGDSLRALGPLGRGFSTASAAQGRVLCVAGGVGCAPFPILIRALLDQGVQDITVINGAATASRLYPGERFSRDSERVRVLEATDDGSRGVRGMVTALLDAVSEPSAIFACGPNAMLAALHRELQSRRLDTVPREASMEAPMGCGFGTCLGCALPVVRHGHTMWELCCSDGPVFDMDVVDWPTLVQLPAAHVA